MCFLLFGSPPVASHAHTIIIVFVLQARFDKRHFFNLSDGLIFNSVFPGISMTPLEFMIEAYI